MQSSILVEQYFWPRQSSAFIIGTGALQLSSFLFLFWWRPTSTSMLVMNILGGGCLLFCFSDGRMIRCVHAYVTARLSFYEKSRVCASVCGGFAVTSNKIFAGTQEAKASLKHFFLLFCGVDMKTGLPSMFLPLARPNRALPPVPLCAPSFRVESNSRWLAALSILAARTIHCAADGYCGRVV
ncbi:hypothetical protein B0H21DRAFT_750663 [Amylocystis lapponica]|nr:hypothetical protein B0H21DRAFT_750663 [Amylocystis lapponica]